MKLGIDVGFGPGHIVLDGDSAPLPQRGTSPNFRPMSVVAKRLDGSGCHLVGRKASAQATVAKRSPISATEHWFVIETRTHEI